MNYILDTNVISELIARHPNEQVVAWVDAQEPTTVYLTVITIGELQRGSPNSRRHRAKSASKPGCVMTYWCALMGNSYRLPPR